MAQATVLNRTRYFCHRCNKEISPNLQDFTCPTCLLGFIEEMNEDRIISAEAESAAAQLFQPLMQVLTGDSDVLPDSGQRDPRLARSHSLSRRIQRRWGPSGNSGPYQNIWEHVDNVLFGLASGTSAPLRLGPMVGVQGNPADYVWGSEGYDNIIARLLSRMEDSGPPPASDERIAALPLVDISDEQIAKEDQCVVCSEEFPLDSKACVLPCKHTFHQDCIARWLKLHDTCPICRKNLAGENTMDASPSPRQPSSAESPSPDEGAPAQDDGGSGRRRRSRFYRWSHVDS